MLGDLYGRQPSDVLHRHGGDLARPKPRFPYASEEVIVFPVSVLEALVEKSYPVEHRARHDPEGTVKATRLDRLAEALPLADDERARHGLRYAKVVDVAV
jgi:hypothetical protein